MKRGAVAGGVLLMLALMPGTTLAIYPGSVDESQTTVSQLIYGGGLFAQTFTAGASGRLTQVDLYMSSTSGNSVAASITATASGLPTGSALATSGSVTPGTTAGWLAFAFATPINVTSGTKYAIVFDTTALGITTSNLGGSSTDAYTFGQALFYGGGWGTMGSMADFGFYTYVNTQSTSLQWNKTYLIAGQSTSLRLDETFTFPAAPSVVGGQPNTLPPFAIEQVSLPSWFTPTGISCSSQVTPADCSLSNVVPDGLMAVVPNGSPITVAIDGTAAPAAGDAGSTGTADAASCTNLNVAVVTNQLAGDCVEGSANIAVIAPGATPPPTSTGASSPAGSPGSAPWFLAAGLAGLLVAALYVDRRRRIGR